MLALLKSCPSFTHFYALGTTNSKKLFTLTKNNNMEESKKKRKRRSYSCASCKQLKIKCDLMTPCLSCVKFKRAEKCLASPPCPPSSDELDKIYHRKQRFKGQEQNERGPNVRNEGTSKDRGERVIPQGMMSTMHVQQPQLTAQLSTHPGQVVAYPGLNIQPQYQFTNDQSNGSGFSILPNLQNGVSTAQGLLQSAQTAQSASSSLGPYFATSLTTTSPRGTSLGTSLSKISPYSQGHGLFERRSSGSSGYGNGSSGESLHFSIYGNTLPPVYLLYTSSQSTLAYETNQDTKTKIKLTALEVQKIKALLPSIDRLIHLVSIYVKADYVYVLNFWDIEGMIKTTQSFYDDLKSARGGFTMNLVEVRVLSLMFLCMATGSLFEGVPGGSTGIPSPVDETSTSSIEISEVTACVDVLSMLKFLKLKIIRHDKLSDTLYLIMWYLIIKSYYVYNNQIVENFMEYNTMLNYVVLNENFTKMISTPKDDYPNTEDFRIIALNWIQVRLVEMELSFFLYKGTMMALDLLKLTLLPHKPLLDVVYGENFANIPDGLFKLLPQVWGLYYGRTTMSDYSKETGSTPVAKLVLSYLNLYADVIKLNKAENVEFQEQLSAGTTPLDEGAFSLLLKNHVALELFVRWLSFIRLEQGYFASLRYLLYVTTMQNVFAQFHIMDAALGGGLLRMLVDRYRYYFLRPFYATLVYQGVYLVVMQKYVGHAEDDTGKVNINKLFSHTLGQYIATVKVITDLDMPQDRTRMYSRSAEAIREMATHLLTSDVGKGKDTDWDTVFDFLSRRSMASILDTQYGSRPTLMAYVEKVAECFTHILESDGPDRVTNEIEFGDELVRGLRGGITGFDFDETVVRKYMEGHMS